MNDATDDRRPPPGEKAAPVLVRLEDYAPPPFLVETVDLRVELGADHAAVRSELVLRRNPRAPPAPDGRLVLDGRDLELVRLRLDGEPVAANRFHRDAESLRIDDVPERFRLEVATRIEPQRNTELEGLYRSGELFCTQCEAEGFRKITYYPDRPDVMARFTTTVVAERARYPVLLSNGNAVARGDAGGGRHWVRWHDPHPKPSYLFALVAGDLACIEDAHVTASGREVALRIYVESHNRARCGHAMASLERAMRWDEEVFGREYDLDAYMVVAVDDFNMGAMENKGLNIFNSKYVLADPRTATDTDYENIEAVIAHEYFHNWTGNRVTCRDWFQLSLKEGLTVFRDQQFTADLRSRAVKRIGDVRLLRTAQFKEDAGPMAHPVRPDAYMEINNFYTVTVYNKGAELVRMIHRLLGPVRFRAGMDLYFARHDGEAVTTDDFVAAMQDASGVDLAQFKRWYTQAGTPRIEVSEDYDPASGEYALRLRQQCPPAPDGKAAPTLHVPVAFGLLTPEGQAVRLGEPGAADVEDGGETRVVHLREREQTVRVGGLDARPVSSVLRGFSAPVRLVHPRPAGELAFLLRHDPDPFNRWEAGQQHAERQVLAWVDAARTGADLRAERLDPELAEALRAVAAEAAAGDGAIDRALVAQILTLPSESYLADQLPVVDVEALHAARRHARREIARALADELETLYAALACNAPYRFDTEAAARRLLANVCLGYLMELEGPAVAAAMRARCLARFRDADNMTDTVAALALLCETDGVERRDALAEFEARWRGEPLVLDKWFALQAGSSRPGTLEEVVRLRGHPAYDPLNPNRVRALIGTFAHHNQLRFHAADGSGYRFLGAQIGELDPLNPQVAARLASAFSRWRSFDPDRRDRMRAEMERILAGPRLSRDTFEILTRSLAPAPAPGTA